MQRILAIARLTWKSAFRYRLFWIMAALLLVSVGGLPLLLKDDGTAKGLAQILLTYTLSSITALLAFFTLWLACGTLAKDVEECQMQMIVVKPIYRWQVWIGKWVGIIGLNAGLLALSGLAVYAGLMWRAHRLPPAQQQILRSEVLVARASARPPVKDLQPEIDRAVRSRIGGVRATLTPDEKMAMAKQVVSAVIATNEEVAPGNAREWKIDMSHASAAARNAPMQLRVKFHTSGLNEETTYDTLWLIGPQESQRSQLVQQSLPAESFQEFDIPPGQVSDDGTLTIGFLNRNELPLLFPLDEGVEVLYRENTFGINFCRGLAIILCWLGFLAAIGLATASFLSFPVAAFASLGILAMAAFGGTLKSVVENGTVASWDAGASSFGHSVLDFAMVPMFKGALEVINLVTTFSPVDYLSSGRSITWQDLGLAVAQIIFLLGGIFACFGIIFFSRRELATVQGQS
ncbi:MAG TPA: ABC transporter permease [Verrucomicrobiae bacterium]|nr:ABC transporter permease [Verrucomicrobiae bacterium]